MFITTECSFGRPCTQHDAYWLPAASGKSTLVIKSQLSLGALVLPHQRKDWVGLPGRLPKHREGGTHRVFSTSFFLFCCHSWQP
eukprot:2012556-Ditylum_brightwellii.AAC.1